MDKQLTGKPVATKLKNFIKAKMEQESLQPTMALIQLGKDPASQFYVENIIKNGAKLGCHIDLITLAVETTEAELAAKIQDLNDDVSYHGIMIQKPLPRHIDDTEINSLVSPLKDIDSLNPINLGKIVLEADGFLPCTPFAVWLMMQYYGIDPQGKKLVILGRSAVVGKPLANILLWKRPFANATVTVCHSKTKDLEMITQEADILISAIGVPHFVKPNMIRDGAILIDVGINEVSDEPGDTKYVGDIDYNGCIDKALAITPVPGGVGTVTTAVLMANLVKASLGHKYPNKKIDGFFDLIFNA